MQPRLSVCQTVCLSVCLSIYLPIRASINREEPEPDKIQVTGKTEDGAQVRIQRGDRGSGPPPPPGKSKVIWVSIGNKQLDPPPHWKKLDPPP